MATDADASQLEELLGYLKQSRGFDFTGYKKTTLSRRIEKRVSAVGASGYAGYQDYLEVNPREFTELFNTILINVTSFFRDEAVWEHIAEEIVPSLLERLGPDDQLRVWSAGCASGEEAYTAAIVLAEAIGPDAFKSRVKIYATDLDDDALAAARHGVYTNEQLKPVPEALVETYFEPNTRGLAFRPDLRHAIIFGRNDLISDAPISRIDLLICRNVLMYFTPEAQSGILERFNFALDPQGFLFLGKSEMLITHGELFSPYSLKSRVFRKVQRNNLRERLAFVGPAALENLPEPERGVRAAAAARSPVAQIVVDRGGYLVDANRRARDLFGLVESDIGRPFQDVPLSYRPADLRSAIDQATAEQGPVQLVSIPHNDGKGKERILDIETIPIRSRSGEMLGVTVSFTDVSSLVRLENDYQRSKRDLETAYEELQSTVEELETTNEELQSTVEELETTNEELQSTNEELETMNEELQSTNDELETMNNEVNSRVSEVDRVNLFLEGILGSVGVGVAVIDRERSVQVWNAMSTDLWGLRADEAEGSDFTTLDIGLPVTQLEDAIAQAFGGADGMIEERLEATNRRGQRFECLVRVTPLRTRAGDVYAAMILAAPVMDGGAPEYATG
jgi:two-component system CheB/CheR fusion protein